jgi:hypothetical protein
MSSIIDMVGAAILFGVLILTVARIQGNLNATMYQNTFNVNTQGEAVFLARVIEHDLTKAGYGVTGQKMYVADSTRIAFVGAMVYGGAVDSVAYSIGAMDSTTKNPADFTLVRYARSSGGSVTQHIGMTYFHLFYYNTSNALMSTPVTGSGNLAAIRAVRVKFRVESQEPVQSAVSGDTSYNALYNAVTWEKLIYPRNLGKPF